VPLSILSDLKEELNCKFVVTNTKTTKTRKAMSKKVAKKSKKSSVSKP
jgi:hypothetical protein